MTNKVKVHGQAFNRTALGIGHAYLTMYPQATLDDLNKAFPKDKLNTWAGADMMFMDLKDKEKFDAAKEKEGNVDWMRFSHFYFEKPSEQLLLEDGTKACMFAKWDKNTFPKIEEHAKQYGIEVASFKESEGGGKRGEFRLEYLNGYIPPAREKKKSKWWLWLLLGLLLAAILLFLLLGRKSEPVVVEKIIEKEVIIKDTVYIQQLQKIEKNFNAAQFKMGKADLSEEEWVVRNPLTKRSWILTEEQSL